MHVFRWHRGRRRALTPTGLALARICGDRGGLVTSAMTGVHLPRGGHVAFFATSMGTVCTAQPRADLCYSRTESAARKLALMALLGLLLLLLVAAVAIAVVINGDGPAKVGFDWFNINTDVTGVFLTGVSSVLLALLGLWLLKAGLRRSAKRRAEMRGLRQQAEASEKQRGPKQSSPQPSAPPNPGAPAPARSSSSTPGGSAPSATSAPSASAAPSRAEPEGPDEYFDTAPREK